MKTTEVNKELIGKRCECIFTGLMVTGVIEDIQDDRHSTAVKVRFDHPHQWGDDLYNDVWAWGRKIDEFGTLHHLHLLVDKPDKHFNTILLKLILPAFQEILSLTVLWMKKEMCGLAATKIYPAIG